MRRVLSALGLVVLLMVVYLLGTFATHFGLFPYPAIRDASQALIVLVNGPPNEPKVAPREIDSIFVRLAVATYEVPAARPGAGGGLTSFGDALIVMPHDGRLFSFENDELRLLSIRVPDNGLAALMARAETEAYAGLEFSFDKFRYNDILYYRDAGAHGLVLSFTEWRDADECYGTTVAHLPLPSGITSLTDLVAEPEDWQIAYRTQPCLPTKQRYRAIEGHMAGGRIAYRGGGKVVLASGDYAIDGVYADGKLAQQADNDYGKTLEIDLAGRSARRLSLGHSNAQGIAVDRNGAVWLVEHGRRGGDELNLIVEGGNYGWPEATLGTRYNGLPWPGSSAYGRHDGFVLPVFAWLPSVAVSSLTVLNGTHPSWDGDLMAGSLIGNALFRIRVREGRAIFTEEIRVGSRIRAVHQHTGGRLALWTDDRKLMILTASDRGLAFDHIARIVKSLDGDDDRKRAVAANIDTCAECHAFDSLDTSTAPALGQVFGRAIAGSAYPGYSGALRTRGGAWTAEALTAFLDDPEAWAPGSAMPDPNIEEADVISGIVEVLRRIKEDPE